MREEECQRHEDNDQKKENRRYRLKVCEIEKESIEYGRTAIRPSIRSETVVLQRHQLNGN
jgi:hypothetical protein